MKGVVFTEFLDMVEQRYGIEVLDDVLGAASVTSVRDFDACGTYDWREFAKLTQALADRLEMPMPSAMRGYGQHMFGFFVRSYSGLLTGAPSAFDFLENVEALIHPEVRKLYPDAELPSFDVERTGGGMTMHYRSKRPFAQFALGLIEGCLLHYGEPAEVVMDGDDGNCTFSIVAR